MTTHPQPVTDAPAKQSRQAPSVVRRVRLGGMLAVVMGLLGGLAIGLFGGDALALTLDYRYFATNDPKFEFGPVSAKSEYRNHTVLAGLRYTFGAPPPPPPAPAAAPAPAAEQAMQNEFLVFFDWDRSDITPASDAIIGDAATAAGNSRAIKLEVIGHTDTSGSPTYNQRLSLRRAEAVRQALIAKGVPASLITIEGRGETDLMVSSGTNVREPSIRRAQMLIRVS